jgi:hypothetical protein
MEGKGNNPIPFEKKFSQYQPIYKDKDKAEENFKMWDLNQDEFITEEE